MNPQEQQVVPSTQNLDVLTALLAASGAFYHPDLHLYANVITLSRATVEGDLVEATFAGYAKVTAMVWGAPYVDVDGTALAFGVNHTWVATDGVTPNTIYGYYLTDSMDADLWAAYALAQPVGMDRAGAGLTIIPSMRYSGT